MMRAAYENRLFAVEIFHIPLLLSKKQRSSMMMY